MSRPDVTSRPGLGARLVRHYGAGPFHLLGLLGCFVLSAYVACQIAEVPQSARIGFWFVGAVVVHDLMLWPAYALADRLVLGLARRPRPERRVPWVNHIRVPAVLSAVLLVVSFPLVLNWSGRTYRNATGLSPSPFTARWMTLSVGLFAASAVVYMLRLASSLAHRRRGRGKPTS